MTGAPLLEIRTYRCARGRREELHRVVSDAAVPLLERIGVDVVAFGPSVEDDEHYVLIRAFASAVLREIQLDVFDSSDEWSRDHAPAMAPLVESHHTVVVELSPALAGLLGRDRLARSA